MRTSVATRGNILDAEGRLLAISCPIYQFYMDCTVLKETNTPDQEQKWLDKARELAAGLDFVPDVFFFDTAAAGHRELARILREKGTLVYFEPCNPKDPACMKSVELADVVKFSNEDFPDVSFLERYPDKLFIQTLGGPEGARFRFPGHDWQVVPGFVNDNVINPEGSGDWTTMGFLSSLWRSGGVRFASLTPERVAAALSTISSPSPQRTGGV